MFYERAARRGPRCPRPAAYQSPREGVEFIHARRPLWTGPLSFEVVLRMPRDAATRPKSSKNSGASITRPEPATTCATGSQGTRPRHLPSAASWPTFLSAAVTMSPPRKERSGPRTAKPEDRHQNIAAATAKQQGLVVMVRQGRRRHRYPVASASLYEPACERTWWWISLRCPHCGSVHLHRVRREEDAGGVRRTGCGRRVFVKIRTVYRGKTNLRTVA
jgi:hypothetical protein